MDKTVHTRFLETYDTYSDAVFRQCLFRVGKNRDIALDLTQEAFMKTWEYLAKGNEVTNLKAFVFRVANNLIKDYWRKKKPILERDMEEGYFESVEDTGLSPEERLEYKLVSEAIERLEPIYQDVLILRLIEEYPVQEIARILNISESNASVRIHRGIKKLQMILGHEN